MSIAKSFVLPATFPSSKNSLEALENSLEYLKPYDFSVVEYYIQNSNADKVRCLLEKWKTVFLAAALQKACGLNPSSKKADERKKAVKGLCECMKFALQAGATSVLINSGPRPNKAADETNCIQFLKESICTLHHCVKELDILLEPGDRDVEYFHLIGPTPLATSFAERLQPFVPSLGLVFDTSHIAQLGEDIYTSWPIAKPYCSHIHLSNCVLDKNSSLYGDKHPPFGIKDSVFTHQNAHSFYAFLQNQNLPLTVGIEMICNQQSEPEFFKQIALSTEWFFGA